MIRLDCPQCGAAVRNRSARFCEFCGTEVPRPSDDLPHSLDEQRRVRLQRLEAHPDFESWKQAARQSAATTQPFDASSDLFANHTRSRRHLFISFSVIAILIVASSRETTRANVLVLILVGAFAAVLAVIAVRLSGQRSRRTRVSPPPRQVPEPRAAIVVDERSDVGSRLDSAVRTSYFVTLQFSDGRRTEFPVDAQLAGRLTREDTGAAIIDGRALTAFHRIEI